MTEGRIEARELGKCYGSRESPDAIWALRDVNLEVPPGGALALVGDNGSGKSTLLDLLMRTTQPSKGALEIGGAVATLVELGAGFFPELTGRENARQACRLAGVPARQLAERELAIAEFAELGAFFDRPLRTYSAGMAMRLGFALAARLQAPITLIDEVLAVGDGYFQRKCIDHLVGRRRAGSTLVIASHDLHALRSLCDQALWLRRGEVAALGAADAVIGRYEEHLRLNSERGEPGPGRRGTGEVLIHAVRLTDESGREVRDLRFGSTLRVEIEFETTQPIDSPVMGVALFRDDGVYCHGPNTKFDGCLAGEYDGRYRLSAEFPKLRLLPARYEVSVAFYDKEHVYAYAWDHRLYAFRVTGGPEDHGVVALPHEFRIERVNRA